MIGKTTHNQDFKSTCAYVARDGAVHLGGNMVGVTAKELAYEFELLRTLRPGLKKPVVHLMGAFAPTDRLTDEEMMDVAQRFIEEQGYAGSLYSVWRHFDGTTDHFHAITMAFDLAGRPITQSFERFKTKRSCRMLEREFGLLELPNIRHEPTPTATDAPSLWEPDALDVEIPSVTTEVGETFARLIRESLPRCKTFGDFASVLAETGLRVVPQIHRENGQLYGLGFRMVEGPLKGAYLAASKVPGGFSPKRLLTKHGLSFDPDRDLPLLLEPRITPPLPEASPEPTPKRRRTKKGDRQHARHRNHTPRTAHPTIANLWIPGSESIAVIAGGHRDLWPPRLGSPLLAYLVGASAPYPPVGESLLPPDRGGRGGLAGNYRGALPALQGQGGWGHRSPWTLHRHP